MNTPDTEGERLIWLIAFAMLDMISGELDRPNFDKKKATDDGGDYLASADGLVDRGEVELLMDYIAQVDMELKEVENGLKRLLRRPF